MNRVVKFAGLLLPILMLAVVVACSQAEEPEDRGPRPSPSLSADFGSGGLETITDLTDLAPVVVLGAFEEKSAETCELPYDYAANQSQRSPGYEEPQVPVTYYQFRVSEVLHADSGFGEISPLLSIRLAGHETEDQILFGTTAAPTLGVSYLLVLAPNPDGQSFGPISPFHMIEIDGNHMRYSSPGTTSVELAGGEWDQFRSELVAALKERGDSDLNVRTYPEVPNRAISAAEWDCDHLEQGPRG